MSTTAAAFPTVASGWTNSGNVYASDGVRATTPFNPTGGALSSAALLCGGFTFVGVTAGDTINGFDVNIKLAKTAGTDFVTQVAIGFYRGGLLQGTGYAAQGTVAGGADTVYNFNSGWGLLGGLWTSADLANFQIVVYASCGSGSGSETIGIDYVTVAVDHVTATAPTAFAFTPVTGAALSATSDSNNVTVAGPAHTSILVTGTNPAATWYQINNNGVWILSTTRHADLAAGDVVKLRVTTSVAYSTLVGATLALGVVTTASYLVTTRAQDTAPDAFTFAPVANAIGGASYTSSTITIAGIDSTCACSVAGSASAQYSVNGGAFTAAAGTVALGDTVCVKVTADAAAAGTATATFTAGGVSSTFTLTTITDTTPDAFAFTAVTGATTSTLYTSNTITVLGINSAAALSFSTSGGSVWEYSKNAGAYTAVGAGTLALNDTLTVRMISPAAGTDVGNLTVTIGGVSGTYSVSTGAVVNPSPFSFTSVTGASGGVMYTSGTATLAGMTAGVPVIANIIIGAECQVNGGAWTSATVSVQNGDTVALRALAGLLPLSSKVLALAVGTTVGTFTITTGNVPPPLDF